MPFLSPSAADQEAHQDAQVSAVHAMSPKVWDMSLLGVAQQQAEGS
jgi:hypothetical protein